MSENRERDISRLGAPGWAGKFARYLEELAPVGPGTARKYSIIVRGLLGKSVIFSLDEASKIIKRKNRVYVRAAIVMFIDFLEHENILSEEDALIWKKKLPKVREPPALPRDIPTIVEILPVIKSMDPEDRRIARLMLYTGCRIHEALELKLKDINFKTGSLTLYGKGRLEKKPRPAKIPIEFASEIEAYAKDLGLLAGETIFWPNSKATTISKVDIFNRKFKRAGEEILGRTLGTHDLRRIVATKLLEETGDLQLVQQLLGHEKLETTQRYTKYVDRERQLERARDIMTDLSRS